MAETRYEGRTAAELSALLGLPRVELYESVPSTMDVAHALGAAGAMAGTLVLAEQQTAGRGRAGRQWASAVGSGIWLTLLERPNDPSAIDLLTIRLGLRAARALDRFAPRPVQLKWPNDLYVQGGKLAGILVETRWRDRRIDWVAIGVGLNVRPPEAMPHAAALRGDAARLEVLAELLPALRAAAAARGPLSDAELAAYAERDLARGRRGRAPAAGTVVGIDSRGSLIVRTAAGEVAHRSGSLVLEEGV
ncbi:MAG: biotin--[acetyl-CoA-carboxylase] ligase [Gemmatimonadaceae bacterium]|nr:biotin--[acetyl-CoA-carboxylase] ligase [Gemmatimonadaceae bacterium]